jgi:hypothetical protein
LIRGKSILFLRSATISVRQMRELYVVTDARRRR